MYFDCPYKKNITCVGRSPLTACKRCGDDIILKEGEVPMNICNNEIIIRLKDGVRTYHNCRVCPPPDFTKGGDICDREITEYYLCKEAHDAGWKYTNHILFCPPNERGVWVCPECSKDFNWIKETREVYNAYDGKTISYQEVPHGV